MSVWNAESPTSARWIVTASGDAASGALLNVEQTA
jgi:hypothetical protein